MGRGKRKPRAITLFGVDGSMTRKTSKQRIIEREASRTIDPLVGSKEIETTNLPIKEWEIMPIWVKRKLENYLYEEGGFDEPLALQVVAAWTDPKSHPPTWMVKVKDMQDMVHSFKVGKG